MSYTPEPDADGLRRYGQWAGNSKGWPEDKMRCITEVYEGIGRAHQCPRKRGHGPDGLYCKQHDPEAVKVRQEASSARYNQSWNLRMRPYRQRDAAFEALKKIATGYNDARSLAEDLLRKWDEI
jgi:hypothetical protein